MMNTITYKLHYWIIPLLAVFLAACQMPPMRGTQNLASITSALDESVSTPESTPVITTPAEDTTVLSPPDPVYLPDIKPETEQHFDISVNDTPAHEFFMSLVKGTELNMVVHPDVSGNISISLNDVSLDDVLATARDVYGYRYRLSGNTYQVFPARMRTQIFTVDYLHIMRSGGSRTLVSSGQLGQNGSSNNSGNTNTTTRGSRGGGSGGDEDLGYVSGSVVKTISKSDFWDDLATSLNLIVGTEEGRKVVIHPQTGLIVVHAMPQELRDVEDFLHSIEEIAHRLVIIEAKILEVTLNDNFQAGINWNALIEFGDDKSILFGHNGAGSVFTEGNSGLAGKLIPIGKAAQTAVFPTPALGGLFTINADLKDFNALIELLKVQGDVQVLSSPRISTVNNQKAIIKVGQDEYFVTDFSSDIETSAGIGNNVQTVDVTLTPFFSGIALDVIPQISNDGSVILHIHPAISEVTEKNKEISITTEEKLSIPLALSTIRESDSIIRAKSGQVVILGGLMKDVVRDKESRTPFLGDIPGIGHMFRNINETTAKSELVILLRPIVINSDREWNGQLRETADRFQHLRSANTAGQ